MSEQMDHAIINMPFDIAMSDELSRRQFYARAQGILSERDQLRAEVDALRADADAKDGAERSQEEPACSSTIERTPLTLTQF